MLLWKQRGYADDQMPELLIPVDCPQCVFYLWEYWLDMNQRGRTSNGFNYNPITNLEVESWARRRRITLLPFENLLLDALESVFLRIRNKEKQST